MPDTGYLIASVAVAAAVTWALRALPFAVLAPLRDSPVLRYLSVHMPAGVMVVLVVYSLQGTGTDTASGVVPVAAALAVTAGLHLWRRSALLSILSGTALHVVLASWVFAS